MIQSKDRVWVTSGLAALIYLSACSQEAPADRSDVAGSSAQIVDAKTPNTLVVDIAAPNPKAMDSEVAAVVKASWDKLQTKLSNEDITAETRADAYAAYGLSTFGNGLTIIAETAFTNANNLAPKDTRWVYFLALMHQYNGKLDEAAISFTKMLELSPGNQPALLRLAKVRFEQANLQVANDLYRQVLGIDKNSAAAYYGLGRTASTDGRAQEALTYFEKALELQPGANRINYFLGMTWRNLGEMDKAKNFLSNHGPIEPSFSDPLFDKISGGESRIDGLWAHMNAGSQAFVDGSYAKAVDEFRLATQDLPDDPRSWQSLGMALNKNSQVEDSIEAYSKALALDEDNAVIHHELSKLKISKGANKQAELHLQQAISIDPRMLAAHASYARLMFDSGRLSDALTHYESAISLDPQSGELAVARADTLMALGRDNEAMTSLAQMLEINPRDSNVRMAYSLVLADTQQLDKAQTEVARALKDASNKSTQSRAHYATGRIALKRGDADAALSSFGSALKLDPKNRPAGLELARTFIRLKDYKQALGTYEVLLNNWPNNDGARIEAARVSVMMGNGSKARTILEVSANQQTASARLLGSLARLLVLSTESHVKNPTSALEYAQRAKAKSAASQHEETLALCHAALGNFDTAVEVQQRLLENSMKNIEARIRSRMEKNLSRYRSNTLGRLPFDAS